MKALCCAPCFLAFGNVNPFEPDASNRRNDRRNIIIKRKQRLYTENSQMKFHVVLNCTSYNVCVSVFCVRTLCKCVTATEPQPQYDRYMNPKMPTCLLTYIHGYDILIAMAFEWFQHCWNCVSASHLSVNQGSVNVCGAPSMKCYSLRTLKRMDIGHFSFILSTNCISFSLTTKQAN